MRIETPALIMIAADQDSVRADLSGREALEKCIGVSVPDEWPPELYDHDAMNGSLEQLGDPDEAGWALWYLVPKGVGVLAGVAGYKGKPVRDRVEVGYSIPAGHRRRGYATEAVQALVDRAFAINGVERVIAETLPELAPSIGVLHKCGFNHVGDGDEPGVIKYEVHRSQSAGAPE